MNDPKIAQCERQSDSSSSGRKARQRADVSSSYKDVQINWRINSKSDCPIDLEEGKGRGEGNGFCCILQALAEVRAWTKPPRCTFYDDDFE